MRPTIRTLAPFLANDPYLARHYGPNGDRCPIVLLTADGPYWCIVHRCTMLAGDVIRCPWYQTTHWASEYGPCTASHDHADDGSPDDGLDCHPSSWDLADSEGTNPCDACGIPWDIHTDPDRGITDHHYIAHDDVPIC